MTDDLLIRFLLGECSEDERASVHTWMAAHPDNARQFGQFEWLWQQSKRAAASSNIDEDKAWNQFVQLRSQAFAPKTTVIPLQQKRRWLQVAAALVMLIGAAFASWIIFKTPTPPPMMAVSTQNFTKTDSLPDGSLAMLNKNSRLERPSRFTGKTRRVKLQGEAFFTIEPNQEKPFIIEAGPAEITVVGTSFNVRTADSVTEVIVETGRVQVAYHHQTVVLHQGQKILLTPADTVLKVQPNHETLHQYYRTNVFVCDNTSLQDLASALSAAYNTPIIIERNDWKNLPLSATFHNESLDTILSIVAQTLEISYQRQGKTIIFK